MIRASDTDVLVILLKMLGRHLESHRETSYRHVIMDCGSVNNRSYINVNDIATTLESMKKGLDTAMPGLHASTGCDFTTAFYTKGKVTFFRKTLQEHSSSSSINFLQK